MIQVDGNFLPNLEYHIYNVNSFEYESGSYTYYYNAYEHYESGSTDGTGLFSVNVYPTMYQFVFNEVHKETIYYKDFRQASDYETVGFGGKKSYLSGTTWS